MSLFPIYVKSGKRSDEFKVGYIGREGALVIPTIFSGGTKFRNGLASVREGRKWGVIDEKGSFLVAPFSGRPIRYSEERGIFDVNGKCGVIDMWGEIILQPSYYLVSDYSEGIAWMANEGAWLDKPGSHGFLNRDGSVRIPCFFDDARGFREGLAPVKIGGKWGFIESTGELAIPAMFDLAVGFSEGLARVQMEGKCGFINHEGNFSIAPSYTKAHDFKENLAAIQEKGSWGYIDQSGHYVIEPKFDRVGPFSEGLARVEHSGACSYIDKSGESMFSVVLDWAYDFHQGLALVMNADQIGYIDRSGKWVWSGPRVEIGADYLL